MVGLTPKMSGVMSEVKSFPKSSWVRRGRGQGIGISVQKILSPLAIRQGFRTATILTHWGEIVGSQYAPLTVPLKVTYIPRGEKEDGAPIFEATLHVMVKNTSTALTLKYVEPQILERLNSHFGYSAIQKMKLHHGISLESQDSPKQRRSGSRPPKNRIETPFPKTCLEDIQEESLKNALSALGDGVWGER